ncbi:uncharacterized protein METZ01_LOCUS442897, partial [marine metagenome]
PPELEYREPQLDEQSLKELATQTGGSYSQLWNSGKIPEKIDQRPEVIVTKDEPLTLWDNWLSLYLLAGLLTVEWILRKLAQLL